jgi:hypothetical protein
MQTMKLPIDLKLYSGTCGSTDGTSAFSVRFLLTPLEYETMLDMGILPPDTSLVEHIEPAGDLPALHDLHLEGSSRVH